MLLGGKNSVSSLYFSTDKPQSGGEVKEIPDINSSRDEQIVRRVISKALWRPARKLKGGKEEGEKCEIER